MTAHTTPSIPNGIEDVHEGNEGPRMSFGDHLEELRGCLVRSLVGVALGTTAAFFSGKELLELLFRPLWQVQAANHLQPRLQALSPTAAFSAYMKIALLGGFLLSLPWVLHQLWRFVATGLYARERRFVRSMVWPSIGLMLLGELFLYYFVLPIILQFFVSFNRSFETPFAEEIAPPISFSGVRPASNSDSAEALLSPAMIPVLRQDPPEPNVGDIWVNEATNRLLIHTTSGIQSAALEPGTRAPGIESQFAIDFYLSFVLMMGVAFAVGFQTPVVVFFLGWSGLVSAATMASARRYVLLATVIVSAVATPPDVVSQMMLAIPIYLLFEAGLLALRLKDRSQSAPNP